jgi:hypothetical protein
MTNPKNYYLDLLLKKLDLHIDVFLARIEARKLGNWERVEYLEEMVSEPLRRQINYLSRKVYRMLGGRDI